MNSKVPDLRWSVSGETFLYIFINQHFSFFKFSAKIPKTFCEIHTTYRLPSIQLLKKPLLVTEQSFPIVSLSLTLLKCDIVLLPDKPLFNGPVSLILFLPVVALNNKVQPKELVIR